MKLKDGGVYHFEFWQLYIFNVIDVFLIKVPMFQLSLVKIGQIIKKWPPFFEIQDGGGRHIELRLLRFLNFQNIAFPMSSINYVPSRSPIVSTNVGDAGSNTKEMAADFRNARCRQPPS